MPADMYNSSLLPSANSEEVTKDQVTSHISAGMSYRPLVAS